jgi:hypothetical protein
MHARSSPHVASARGLTLSVRERRYARIKLARRDFHADAQNPHPSRPRHCRRSCWPAAASTPSPPRTRRPRPPGPRCRTNISAGADLIPNLVATVKGYAAQEKGVLVEVTQARASATQVKVDASTITDPAQFQQYAAAQDKLSGVLGRLMMIQESYPDLKSNQNFLALQSQLEGTENRIAIARRDYNRPPRLQHDPADLPERDLGQDAVRQPEAGPVVPGHGRPRPPRRSTSAPRRHRRPTPARRRSS